MRGKLINKKKKIAKGTGGGGGDREETYDFPLK
jgi:hypothetical protein